MHPLAMSTEVESAFAIPTELADNKSQAAHLLSGVPEYPQDVLTNKIQFREYVCLGFPEAAAGEIGRL